MGDDGVTMVITVQYFDGCPGWEVAGAHLEEAATQLGLELDVELQRVETLEAARRLGFIGSPTIQIAGTDPFASPGTSPGLACRLYATPDGSARAPATAQLVAVLAARRADQPAGTGDQGLLGVEGSTRP